MPIEAVEIPAGATAGARHFDKDELAQAAELIRDGNAVSDGVLYDEPYKKMDARSRAQYQAYYMRQELVEDGHFDSEEITSRTWPDGNGFRFAVRLK